MFGSWSRHFHVGGNGEFGIRVDMWWRPRSFLEISLKLLDRLMGRFCSVLKTTVLHARPGLKDI